MGQISLPVLNRTGYTMFWSSTWDNKFNFQTFFKEDILIRRLIPAFFSNVILSNRRFLNQKLFLENSTLDVGSWQRQNPFIDFDRDLLLQTDRMTYRPTYFNKIWIFRFKNWVIVFVIFFSPTFNILDLNVLKLFLEKSTKSLFFEKKKIFFQKINLLSYLVNYKNSFYKNFKKTNHTSKFVF